MHRPLILIGCFFASSAVAEPTQMTGETIKAALSGSRLDLDTPAGTTIPVNFSTDGMVSGEAGVLAAVLGSAKDRGRWWVEDDKLCLKWFRWFDAKRRCIDLKQDGTRIHWRDQSGETGTGTLAQRTQVAEKPAPLPTPFALGAMEVAKKPAAKKQVVKEQTPPVEAPVEQAVATQPGEAPAVGSQVAYAQVPAEPASNEQPANARVASAEPAARDEASASDMPRMRFTDMASLVSSVSAAEPSAPPPQPREITATPAPSPEPVKKHAEQPAPPPAQKKAKPKVAAAPARQAVKANPPPAPVKAPPVELFKVAGVVEGDILNVRNGPSEFHPTVGGIAPQGRGVQIVGPCRDQWCPIRYGRVSGWVNRAYLVAETTVATAPPAPRSAR